MGQFAVSLLRMKEMPGFIKRLVHVLAECEDVDESTIVYLSARLAGCPRAAVLLTSYAEIGYSNSEKLLSECQRLLKVTGGR